MATKREIIGNLQFEIEKLKENPIYLDYVKLSKVLNEGKMIESTLLRKIKYFRSLTEPQEEEYEELEQEVPRRKIVPKMKREDYIEPTPQREKELNEKIKRSFDVEPDELGLNDDIPGLPDDFENEEGGN